MCQNSRHVCTADDPWTKEKSERSIHPDAEEIDSDYGSLGSGGSYIQYKCPHCKESFWVELPD